MAVNATQGTLLKLGGVTIAQRVRIKPAPSTNNKIETTDLDSVAEESIPGIERNGEYELEINYDPDSATHATLWSTKKNRTTGSWDLVLQNSGNATYSFDGWISAFEPGEAVVDGLQKAIVKIQVTGEVVLAT